jgi:hypothetical protein
MATDLHSARPTPGPKKYEAFVETQLARARARIRALDVGSAGLGLLIVTLTYGLILALCDRWLELSPLIRQLAFAFYVVGALGYVGLFVVRPLCRPINPYYAARRLEETIPEAKNSIVNWLDLRQQPIALAFRNAISHQAATDLRAADLEQAISARRAAWLGGAATALFVCLLILFVLGPRQFFSLMNRAFAPFSESPIATRTRLEIERPEGGDVTIPIGRAIDFSVWVEGRIPETSSPEALKLLYRYNLGDPYQTRPLERGESSREWFTSLLASEVHNGLWYRMAGGDTQTPEYHVQVRSTPLFTGFDVTYHYRPYLSWPDRVTHDQNLQDLRGTEVTLLAHTNRSVSAGQLVVEGDKPIAGELVQEDPQALRFRLRLEKDNSYRIWFRSTEAERNIDPMAYTIRVLLDHPPQVQLIKPGQDSQLPANGILRLEGSASDDFGLVSLNLRMKVDQGPTLQAKPYRHGKELHRGDGSYPQVLAYRDFVELDKLQKEDGQSLELLTPGSKLEYWLEAKDNCDYPGPNIGESKHFTVTIQPPATDKNKQDQQRQEAGQTQQQHEQKQDQDLKNQKREPRDQPQQQKPSSNDADAQGQKGENQNEDQLNKQKQEIEDAIKQNERKPQGGGKGDSKADSSQQPKGENKGEGNASGQADKGQNQDKETGKTKPQSGQDKSGSKSQTNPANNDQKGEGQAASRSEENQGNSQGQQGAERSPDQSKAEGNKPDQGQKNGANQSGKNPENGPNNEGGQRQEKPAPQPGSGNNDRKTTPAEKQAGEKAQGDQKQNLGQSPQSGSNQHEPKNGSGEKSPQPNAGQGAAGQKSDSQKEQHPGEQQQDGSAEGGKKQSSKTEESKQSGAGKQPETGASKGDKEQPREGASKQGAEQAKGEQKQGAGAEKAEQTKQRQSTGQQQGGEKQGSGSAAPQADKAQPQGTRDARTDKASGSQGDSKADNSATPQSERKTNEGQGGGELKPAPKNGSNNDASQKTVRSQEKPSSEDKARSGSQSATKTEKRENGQNPQAGTSKTDKGQDKDKGGATSRQNDAKRTQQPNPDSQGATKSGEDAKDNVSALSKALKNQDEKTRAAARKRLEELRDHAKDPATRQAAADALEHSGQETSDKSGQKSADKKPGESKGRSSQQAPSKNGAQASGQEQGQHGEQSDAGSKGNEPGHRPADSPKGERKNGNQPDAKPDKGPQKGQPGDQANSSGQPAGTGSSQRSGGDEPKGEIPKANDSQATPNPAPDRAEPPSPANPDYKKQAGELQLEDIKKRINKDVLRKLNMSEEDFQKFVKAYEALRKRKQPAAAEKEVLPGPQRGNRTQANEKVRLVNPREPAKASHLQSLGPILPPPEFREAYKEFSKRISESDQSKEKK